MLDFHHQMLNQTFECVIGRTHEMTAASNHSPLRTRLSLAAAALLATGTIGLASSSIASAQEPAPPAPPIPATSVTGSLAVEVEADDDEVDEGEDNRYRITVRNQGTVAVSDATLKVDLDDGFEIKSVTDGGEKELVDDDDRSREYRLGTLEPGQELEFAVHAELEDVDHGDDGDDFEIAVEVQAPNSTGDEDTVEVEAELKD